MFEGGRTESTNLAVPAVWEHSTDAESTTASSGNDIVDLQGVESDWQDSDHFLIQMEREFDECQPPPRQLPRG